MIFLCIGMVLLLGFGTKIPPNPPFLRGGMLIALVSLGIAYVLGDHHTFKDLVLISTMAIVLFSHPQNEEFFILLLSSTLGALLCVDARDFIHLFVGIELLTVPLYGLIGFDSKNSKNIQAAIKYLLLAGISSGLMLFGIAILYAQSASLELALLSPLGSCLFLAGVCFKLSLAPFHLWTPDVYEDAPLPVTAFLATVSKIAFVGILAQLALPVTLIPVLAMIATLSMLVGAFLTLKSDTMPRFLAYSSIAHMGYVLVAWLTHSNLIFYIAAYSLSVLIIFWMLAKPISNWLLILGFLSLMGIPLTPIFWGKYQILISTLTAEHPVLFAVFVFSSLISVYGYARVISRIYQRTLVS